MFLVIIGYDNIHTDISHFQTLGLKQLVDTKIQMKTQAVRENWNIRSTRHKFKHDTEVLFSVQPSSFGRSSQSKRVREGRNKDARALHHW